MPDACECGCNAVKLPLCFTQGDSYELDLTYGAWSVATPPVFTPIDITNATILMSFSAPGPDGPLLFTIGTASTDAVLTNPTAGQFTVIVPTSATSGLKGNQLNGIYDMVLELPTDATGKPWRQTILSGTFNLQPNVTPI